MTSVGENAEKIRTLECCRWEHKTTWLLQKTLWWLLKKNKEINKRKNTPEIPFLNIHPKELKVKFGKEICNPMFIKMFCPIAKS